MIGFDTMMAGKPDVVAGSVRNRNHRREGPDADDGRVSRDFEADVDLPGLSVSMVTPESWWPRPGGHWRPR